MIEAELWTNVPRGKDSKTFFAVSEDNIHGGFGSIDGYCGGARLSYTRPAPPGARLDRNAPSDRPPGEYGLAEQHYSNRFLFDYEGRAPESDNAADGQMATPVSYADIGTGGLGSALVIMGHGGPRAAGAYTFQHPQRPRRVAPGRLKRRSE